MNRQAAARVCVVGCGYWGKNPVRNFHQIQSLYGFFDAVSERREAFAAQYPGARAYESYEGIECQHFVDCVRTRQQPRTLAEDGLCK